MGVYNKGVKKSANCVPYEVPLMQSNKVTRTFLWLCLEAIFQLNNHNFDVRIFLFLAFVCDENKKGKRAGYKKVTEGDPKTAKFA